MKNRILTETDPEQFLGCLCVVKKEIDVGVQGNYKRNDLVIPLRYNGTLYSDCIIWHSVDSDERSEPHSDEGFSVNANELELLSTDELMSYTIAKNLYAILSRYKLSLNKRRLTLDKLAHCINRLANE